jgi:phosphatidylinositol alpha-1,6-mannosyltransferase
MPTFALSSAIAEMEDQCRPAGGNRILALVTDAYGGHGGIAAYNRDVFDALSGAPEISGIRLLPRLIEFPVDILPDEILLDRAGLGGAATYARALLTAVRNDRFDLIYCAHVNLAPLAWLAAKLQRCPWMLAIYGIEAWEPSRRRSVRFATARADHVVSISRITLDRFRSFTAIGPNRSSIVPNAIRLTDFGTGPRNEQLARRLGAAGRKVVLTFGRLSPYERYKGFDEIISLMPRLIKEVPDLLYLIAGRGDDQARLEARVGELDLDDHVKFAGFIAEEEKADLYRLADVFALPSRGEGFGFVLLEAMACGVPVVASRLDGGYEAVREGELGRVVDPGDADALANAILGALREPKGVPAGLDYFAFPRFVERIRQAVIPQMEGRLTR